MASRVLGFCKFCSTISRLRCIFRHPQRDKVREVGSTSGTFDSAVSEVNKPLWDPAIGMYNWQCIGEEGVAENLR